MIIMIDKQCTADYICSTGVLRRGRIGIVKGETITIYYIYYIIIVMVYIQTITIVMGEIEFDTGFKIGPIWEGRDDT